MVLAGWLEAYSHNQEVRSTSLGTRWVEAGGKGYGKSVRKLLASQGHVRPRSEMSLPGRR